MISIIHQYYNYQTKIANNKPQPTNTMLVQQLFKNILNFSIRLKGPASQRQRHK